jgi:hypothetical protein
MFTYASNTTKPITKARTPPMESLEAEEEFPGNVVEVGPVATVVADPPFAVAVLPDEAVVAFAEEADCEPEALDALALALAAEEEPEAEAAEADEVAETEPELMDDPDAIGTLPPSLIEFAVPDSSP